MKQIGILQFVAAAIRLSMSSRGLTIAIGGALVIQAAYNLLLPVSYKYIFDDAIKNNDLTLLIYVLLFMVCIYVLNGLAGVLQDYGTSRIGSRLACDLQERLFTHIQTQPSGFYTQVPESDIVAAFGPDITAIEMAVVRGIPSFLLRLLTIVTSVTLLFVIQWQLALIALGMMPLIFFASKPFGPRARKAARAADDQQSVIAGLVQENIVVNLAIRTFNLQGQRLEKMRGLLSTLRDNDFLAKFYVQLIGRSAVLAVGFLQLIVLGVGALLAINGHLSAGFLIAFIGLLLNVGGATDNLTQAIPLLVQGASGYSRILSLLEHEPAVREISEAAAIGPIGQSIRLSDVTFGYNASHNILSEVTLEVPAGKTVAIVGGSGSGKSTVLALMMRLYDPQIGTVFIDGADLREVSEASLRRHTGVVLQNTALFNTSIRENIRMGNLSATDAEVEAAAKRAGLDDMIQNLPQGYETSAGSQGGLLSGGQRQRVAIARAFLRNPSVLFLDEATSALDANTEASINDTLSHMPSGSTLISVTHRLAHITDYDLIYVMEKGRLAEAGSHVELLARNGLYAELWNKQSGFTIDETGTAQVELERLRKIPFLAASSDDLLRSFSSKLNTENYPKGRVVFEEGDAGDKFYILARGRMEAYASDAEKTRFVIDDGNYFGELALIERIPRTLTLRALTECVCLTLNKKDFEALLALDADLKKSIVDVATARMAELRASKVSAADVV